jgi:peptidoglycan hydrolase CwlO-like protein
MTKDRALVGVVTALALLVLAVGCDLVSDQGRQEAKKKVEAGQEDLKKKVDEVQTKMDDVQKKVTDLQKKVNELLKKVETQEQQDQKK